MAMSFFINAAQVSGGAVVILTFDDKDPDTGETLAHTLLPMRLELDDADDMHHFIHDCLAQVLERT